MEDLTADLLSEHCCAYPMWNGFPGTFTPLSGFYVPALILLGLDLSCGRDCACDQGLQVILTNLGKKATL